MFCLFTFYSGEPTISFISKNTKSLEDNEVYLLCNATNDADAIHPLKVYWYDSEGTQMQSDGKHIITYNHTNTVKDQAQSILQFKPVKRSNAGTFLCRAYNDPLTYSERKVVLTVECT